MASDWRTGVIKWICGHDAGFAAVSHVPHVLAYALMNHVADSNLSDDKFAMAGAGFRFHPHRRRQPRDVARCVSGTNREAILHDLDII